MDCRGCRGSPQPRARVDPARGRRQTGTPGWNRGRKGWGVFFAADIDPPEAQAWQEALQAAAPGHEWLSPSRSRGGELQTVQADVAVVANPPAGALSQVQGLRLIQSLWAGVDRLLSDRTVPQGLPLARMVDPAMTAAMVQSALWAVTALHRGFFLYAQQQRAGAAGLAERQGRGASPTPASMRR